MIALLRNLHIPAAMSAVTCIMTLCTRTVRPKGPPMRGSRLFCPVSVGSVSIRPITCSAGERHIRTAIGRDYSDVPPTVGTMKG